MCIRDRKGQMTHRATLGTDPRGNLTRIDNALAQMPQRLEAVSYTHLVRRPTPQRTSYDPAAPVYAVGDTVYIENDAYQITDCLLYTSRCV